MAQLTHGQVMSLEAAKAGHDAKGNPLEFKETSKGTWVAEDETNSYTIQEQPTFATVSTVKKNSTAPKINDPYYQRIVANAPVAEGDKKSEESTEARETKEFGKPAKREDVQAKRL